MESVGEPNTRPVLPVYVRSSAPGPPDDVELPHRGDTPKQTYINFEGEMTQLRTDRIVGGKCSRSCIGFVTHTVVLALAAIVGLVMAILSGYGSDGFAVWLSIFKP
jgi:hypothetical protein